ncbi:MAG TPA: hypothetical protein QF802_07450, partial [Candidatus Thalassarchaeaceae archaeon]|nr:hypothetical protein [Candidatus Thalassarchaeaceae archaeon]
MVSPDVMLPLPLSGGFSRIRQYNQKYHLHSQSLNLGQHLTMVIEDDSLARLTPIMEIVTMTDEESN